MYRYAGIVGVDPRGYSYGQLAFMADSRLEQEWLLHGRIAVDLINSQRARKDMIKAENLYPYFHAPQKKKATDKDIQNLAERLKDSTWLKVEMTS